MNCDLPLFMVLLSVGHLSASRSSHNIRSKLRVAFSKQQAWRSPLQRQRADSTLLWVQDYGRLQMSHAKRILQGRYCFLFIGRFLDTVTFFVRMGRGPRALSPHGFMHLTNSHHRTELEQLGIRDYTFATLLHEALSHNSSKFENDTTLLCCDLECEMIESISIHLEGAFRVSIITLDFGSHFFDPDWRLPSAMPATA